GVLLHDTHVDKATAVGFSTPAVMAYDANTKMASLGNDLHPHHERSSLEQSVRNFNTQNPRIQPRVFEDKKHLMQKYAMRGHHVFDSYNLPLI
ncbi:MAG TPA: hypothetical protein VK502_01175, partial [Candidatus Saccharimonadales bacterium]|nr:hypothetical protein [Candidatus Saccharimonadales bacterium]